MFSAWDFYSWSSSLVVILFMGLPIIGFSMLVTVVISRIWATEPESAETPPVSETVKETPARHAA